MYLGLAKNDLLVVMLLPYCKFAEVANAIQIKSVKPTYLIAQNV